LLKEALKECINEIIITNGLAITDIDAILACGMLSSNVGLIEIPHIFGPAGVKDIAANLKEENFPEIIDKPILFVPGVKTGFYEGSSIIEMDIMRGEEAEVFGCLYGGEQVQSGDSIFLHYGSHHKTISTENGMICRSRTALTGELIMAISQNTILKSSLLPLEEIEVDMDWVQKGLSAAVESGFGRALFSTRIVDTILKRSKMEASNFYIGVLLSLDISIVNELMTGSTMDIFLYGKRLFPSIFKPILEERYPDKNIVIISEEESDILSVKGAAVIYNEYLKLK
jgi:2-dehydro-3-deoxygalactonokinase